MDRTKRLSTTQAAIIQAWLDDHVTATAPSEVMEPNASSCCL